ILASWKGPAVHLRDLETKAARLALCEEAVMRDLLRRCGVPLTPGYARLDALHRVKGVGRGSGGGSGSP
ncbi:unnamed protein product, partial [Discosporangium mesarthrocarpum]